MSIRTYRLLGLALTGLLVVGVVRAADGKAESSAPAGMGGMEAPGPAQAPQPGLKVPPGYAEISIAPDVQQRIGVKLGVVEKTPLNLAIRTVGIVRPDETRVAHVHVKTEGWVDKLFVSYIGQNVKAGQPMLSIYSPALFAAEREFLSASRAAKSGTEVSADRQAVVETARRRLELWDVPKDAIEALEKTGVPGQALTLASPISGTVMEKGVFAGQYVTAQSDLYLVADLSTVWVQAKVFEYELPYVRPATPATVSFASLPGRQFAGKVAFVDPMVEEASRTVRVRLELSNPDGQIKPGMFADVSINRPMGSGLTVPSSAVIRTGGRDVVFRAIASDRFMPLAVKINPMRFEDRYQVLEGLKAGDQVVTSANFLIDSESRLEGGGGSGMAGMAGMGGGTKKQPAAQPDEMKAMPAPAASPSDAEAAKR